MIARFLYWIRDQREPRMSSAWLKHQDRREMRIEWHSAPFSWPIKKILDDHPLWNREKLKRRA